MTNAQMRMPHLCRCIGFVRPGWTVRDTRRREPPHAAGHTPNGRFGAMSLLDTLLTPFHTTALTFAGAPTSWGEVAGFVTGAWCVWLVARQNVWNWPIGLLNNLAFLALFM